MDLFQCIERLHELGAVSLRKLITKETILSVPRLDKALPFKVGYRRLHYLHCRKLSGWSLLGQMGCFCLNLVLWATGRSSGAAGAIARAPHSMRSCAGAKAGR